MPSSPAVANPDLLSRIPLTARVVLDVGCGAGALGAAFRPLNPNARLLGLADNEDDAAVARGVLDEVAVVDIDSGALPFDLPRGIDCIVYGDTLQHLKDPFAVLRRHADALNQDGVVLICVPNLEHWSFADHLFRGTWAYASSGLLDATHLRWFTLDTMRQGLLDAGLVPCDVHPRVFDAEAAHRFVETMAPALAALGVDPNSYLQRATPLQFVWRARKTARPRLIVAGSMLAPVGGVSHVRVIDPLRALATDPTVTTQVMGQIPDTAPGDTTPRIFVLHRPVLSGAHGIGVLRSLMANGWLVVTEFDDHPDFFAKMDDAAQLTFRGVHALQTSTPALAQILLERNPEVAIFPNAMPRLPEVRNFTDLSSLTLFFGALNREEDWRWLMPVLNAVADRAGERLKFRIVHDRTFFDALETPHKTFTPTCDYDTYMDLLGRSEISFMPLADNPFNRAKSDLKFIEAGACRVASLASSVVYGDSVVEGETGLLFRDADELRTRLLRLLAMPELAQEIGDNARRYVAEHRMLADQVAPRVAWYRSLWARREELYAARRARLAETETFRGLAGIL
jgi:glycosyltransferase involved in cell wall biosynthesis